MSYKAPQNDRDLHYQRHSSQGRIDQTQKLTSDIGQFVSQATQGDNLAGGLLGLVNGLVMGTIRAIITVVRGIWKAPVRFFWWAFFISVFFYWPLVYIAKNVFNQIPPLLFDASFIVPGVETISKNPLVIFKSLYGYPLAFLKVFSSWDQPLTLFCLAISILPVRWAFQFMSVNPLLYLYTSLNLAVVVNELFTQDLNSLFTQKKAWYEIFFIGNGNFIMSTIVAVICLFCILKQPRALREFKGHGLNAFGESEAGITSTLLGTNNLKSPIGGF
jgi:hypothetical protein